MQNNPMAATTAERIAEAKTKLETLKKQLADIKAEKLNGSLTQSSIAHRDEFKAIRTLRCTRTLSDHRGNVTSIDWSNRDRILLSVGGDGQIIIWDALKRKQLSQYSHRTQWLMACAFEPRDSKLIAVGGTDKTCSIFSYIDKESIRSKCELIGHDGYLSCCKFLNEEKIITTSGDTTAILWDVSRSKNIISFREHAADCLSVAVLKTEDYKPTQFVTGSGDCTAKVWDIRNGSCTHTFLGHLSDVNAVTIFPDGFGIGTASTDSTCKLFDLRFNGLISSFESDESQIPATSICFSRSGRILFAGYDDNLCKGWEVTTTTMIKRPVMTLAGHTAKISCIGINSIGNTLCTGSHDNTMKIWN